MSYLSNRAQLLKPSPTLAMANRARELQAKGLDVISLTVGEPDWATVSVAAEAGVQAIHAGKTKYTAAHGIIELRQEIAKQTSAQVGVPYSAAEVVVGNGAKYVIFAAMMMILDPQDEVLIPSPFWVSYPTMVELAGGVPKVVTCNETVNFKLTPALLRSHITTKTKALILCSPSNPTGLQYSRAELSALVEVLRDYPQVVVISDDIYNRLLFTGEAISPEILQIAPEFKPRVIVVNGVSKTYSMTGWRVGWALAEPRLAQAMADFLSQTTSNLSSISQYAALAALQKGEPELLQAQKNLQSRCERILPLFQAVPGMKVTEPNGAFYFWVDVRNWIGRKHRLTGHTMSDSKQIAETLLSEHLVATVPGSEFGSEGYLRLSFATSEAQLVKAAQRFTEMGQALQGS